MNNLQVLQTVINELGAVCIPTAYLEQIGVPVYNARQKLIALYSDVQQASQKKEEEEKAIPETKSEPEEEKAEE